MSKKPLIRSDFVPYHVTGRANNRDPFPLRLATTWEIVTDNLHLSTSLREIEIHAFVLMPNHFHLLLTVPHEDLGEVMKHFMRSVTQTMNLESGRSGRIFGGPYHWTIVNSGVYYNTVYKYVYRNPVRAGLSDQVENYRWSTLQGLLGASHLPFPLHYPRCGHGMLMTSQDADQTLPWLNRPFPKEVEEAVRAGLRKRNLSRLIDRNTRRVIRPEELEL